MTSEARNAFNKNREDVDRLLEIHTDMRVPSLVDLGDDSADLLVEVMDVVREVAGKGGQTHARFRQFGPSVIASSSGMTRHRPGWRLA